MIMFCKNCGRSMDIKSIFSFALLQLLAGCSIIMSSQLPIARPPEKLEKGVTSLYVDRHYGYPIAYGLNQEGLHTEQIQFINGTPIGWKVARFCTHSTLDALTYCIWEIIGTPIEMANSDYPIYVYYIVYDADGKIIKAVNADTDEGKKYTALYWSLPRLPNLKVNKNAEVRQKISTCVTNDVTAKDVTLFNKEKVSNEQHATEAKSVGENVGSGTRSTNSTTSVSTPAHLK